MRDYLNKVVRAHKKIWMFGSNVLICSENNSHIHLRRTLEIIFFLSIKIIKFSCHGDSDIQYINNLEDVGLANNVDDRNKWLKLVMPAFLLGNEQKRGEICEADNTPKRVRFCTTNAMMTMKDTDYLDEVLEMLNEGGEEHANNVKKEIIKTTKRLQRI